MDDPNNIAFLFGFFMCKDIKTFRNQYSPINNEDIFLSGIRVFSTQENLMNNFHVIFREAWS